VDPLLAVSSDGLFRPSTGSPAIDAAPSSTLFLNDMDGQPRDGLFDIGADEASGAQITRIPLTANDVGAAWFNYTPPASWPPPTQLPPGEFVVVEAESYSSISDPNNDGNVWTTISVAGASGGQVIKAPGGSRTNLPGLHDTLSLYDVTFTDQGDYRAYYLARGFSGSSDSFYTPDDFGSDPADTDNISSNGVFRWENGAEFTIDSSNVGAPVQFRLGRRESDTEIDAVIFHQNGSLSAGQLDAILESATTPNVLKGDVNLSGVVDFADIPPFIAILRAGTFQAEADCDCGGVVNFADIPEFIAILQGL